MPLIFWGMPFIFWVIILGFLVIVGLPTYAAISYAGMLTSGCDAWWVRLLGRSATCSVVHLLMRLSTNTRSYTKAVNQSAQAVEAAIEKAEAKAELQGAPLSASTCLVGGSELAHWRYLSRDMSPAVICNVAFRGARVRDTIRHLSMVSERCPQLVVYCCGTADVVNFCYSGAMVAAGFQLFVEKIRSRRSQNLPVAFLGLALTPLSMLLGRGPSIMEANRLVRDYISQEPHCLLFVEPPEFTPEDFLGDGHHFSEQGHIKLGAVLRPLVERLGSGPELALR